MNESTIKIRLMQADDFDAVVGIDEKVLKVSRPEYYEMKFEKLFKSKDYLWINYYTERHLYCKIDLNTRTMSVCSFSLKKKQQV